MQNPVTLNGYSKFLATTASLTDTAAAIVSAQTTFAPKEVVIQCAAASTAAALVGDADSTPYELAKSGEIRFYISKPELIFARAVGASTATLNILILGD